MPPSTPYSSALDGRDPIAAIPDTVARLERLATAWTPTDVEQRYAPGKWSRRQVLTHLAQCELALGSRVRMALTAPSYAAQSFDQDRWMAYDTTLSGHEAGKAFAVMARMNLAMFAALSPADRQIAFSHPEHGSLTVDWMIHQMAGHQIHHLTQLEQPFAAP